jgi:N-acyl-D-amino-acid deacylase
VRRALFVPKDRSGGRSDAAAHAVAPPFDATGTHPRTYGTFARFLGHYARDLGLVPFEEAVRRMTSLPADSLGLKDRGRLAPGAFADVVVLDPATRSAPRPVTPWPVDR